ncbi:MAG: aldehyde dehydrogenase family protein [Myxococcota bacterium]
MTASSHAPFAPLRGVTEPLDAIPGVVAQARARFETGATRSLDWRLRQLDGIARFLTERETEILDALHLDLGKPDIEAYGAEVSFVANDVAHVKKHLAHWMRPEKVAVPLVARPGSSEIRREPLGVVLIIAPWNYPFQLAMAPLVAALAGGNAAIVKPSEVAPNTAALFSRWLPKYLDAEAVRVIEGGVPETTALLAERFDHVFYTGNGRVGRIVMRAAAAHLTPVTLELGGKSPVIVHRSADIDVAARRIVWGKFFNAGQTCVAPDYVLVDDRVHDALVHRMVAMVREFYGDDPAKSADYGRIVNARHHARLMGLLGEGQILCGGTGDEATRYLAPTILKSVPEDAKVMEDEIFGPILPVLSVPDLAAALRFVNARPHPLALYVFAGDANVQERVLEGTTSGGAVVNHCMLHLAVPDLPFGGVGESGMGSYHGRWGFETFTHRRGVLRKPTSIDPKLLYPPFSRLGKALLRRLL